MNIFDICTILEAALANMDSIPDEENKTFIRDLDASIEGALTINITEKDQQRLQMIYDDLLK